MSYRIVSLVVLLTAGVAPAQYSDGFPARASAADPRGGQVSPVVGVSDPPARLPAAAPLNGSETSAPAAPGNGPAEPGASCDPAGCPPGGCRSVRFPACAYNWQCARAPATEVPPLGTALRTALDIQRSHALAEYFVMFREDFDAGTDRLNPTGERHLAGIARRLALANHPVRVEPTGDAKLDERRRAAVVAGLSQLGIPADEAKARVIAGTTRAEGLRDVDIEIIYGRYRTGGFNGGFGGWGGFGSFGGLGMFGGFYR